MTTHCFELLMQIKEKCDDIDVQKSHYTADGLTAQIQDRYDQQLYEITIKPKQK